MTQWLAQHWYRPQASWLAYLLLPVEGLFRCLVKRRQQGYQANPDNVWQPPVPVVVVGNISVGGVGKTPVVIALAQHYSALGVKVGIVSRGYGGNAPHYPFLINADSSPQQAGDEPLLIAQQTGCPVAVDPQRPNAARLLVEQQGVELILSDDGLQHYALGRTVEIAVIDGARGLGNQHCLPAGPLREPVSRLQSIDYVLINGGNFSWRGAERFQLAATEICDLQGMAQSLQPGQVHGVAGIGNPQRFFNSLQALGYEVIEHAFADHYQYKHGDLDFADGLPVIMTAKDAVKCRTLGLNNGYYLAVSAELPASFLTQLDEQIQDQLPSLKQD